MEARQQLNPANASLMLAQKFRNKTQLYNYLTQRLNVFLPDKDNCRMKFLLEIFAGEKDVVLNEQVPHFTEPNQPEIAVKIVFESLRNDDALMRYFDTDRYLKQDKLPQKHFFWGIMFTVRRDLTTQLISEVVDRRMNTAIVQHQTQPVNFSEVWAQKLLEFPAMQGGGSSRQTNLFQMMSKAKQPVQRKPIQLPETLLRYQEQHQRPDRHVTIRKRDGPNVIRNQSADSEWQENME